MNRIVLSVCILAGLAACDASTRPDETSILPHGPALGLVDGQFTVRNLGTLGGAFSGANAINELGKSPGSPLFPQGTCEQ